MFIYKKAFITSLIISLLTGFLTGIFILQNHPFTKQCATSIICKLMCKSYNCDFKAEVAFINIFSCSLICKNVTVAPLAPEKEEKYWAWNAQQLNFSFSLIDLLTIKKLLLNLRITNAHIETMIDEKNIAITDHIQKLLFSKNFKFPTAINMLKMQNIQLRLYNKEHHIDTLLTWSGTSKKINNQVKNILLKN